MTKYIPAMSEADLFGFSDVIPSTTTKEVTESITFIYCDNVGSSCEIVFELTNDQVQLHNIADQFCLFLRSSGFTYVTSVDINADETVFSSDDNEEF